jgi:hypothetical protein
LMPMLLSDTIPLLDRFGIDEEISEQKSKGTKKHD